MNNIKIFFIVVCIVAFLDACSQNTDVKTAKDTDIPALKQPMTDEYLISRYEFYRDKLHLLRGLEKYVEQKRQEQITTRKKNRWKEFRIEKELANDSIEYNKYYNPYRYEVEGEWVIFDGLRMIFGEEGELQIVNNILVKYAIEDYFREQGHWDAYDSRMSKGLDATWIKPKTTKEEILKEAEFYLNELVGERMKKYTFGEPSICFAISNSPYYGVWQIHWPRTLNGYKYSSDSIEIYLHETYGLCFFACYIWSGTCSTKVKISQTEAEKIAVKLGQEIIENRRDFFEGWRPVFKAEVGEVMLGIINPDYNFTSKYTGRITNEVRLAYIISFNWREDKKFWYQFSIAVDAETGEILGGNTPM